MVDIKFDRAGDLQEQDVHIKGFLFGDPGSGKTWASSTAPQPLFLLTEQNGLTSIRASNPDAKVVYCSDIAKVREYLIYAVKDQLKEHGIRTIVIDSLTEVQRLFKDEIVKSRPDGLFTLKDWSELTDKMRKFMRTIRDIPYHVICTGLAQSETDETTGVRYVIPSFEGKKMPAEIAQYFNFVAYMVKKESTDEDNNRTVIHRALLDGATRYMTKPCHPLGGVLEANITEWFKIIQNVEKKGAKNENSAKITKSQSSPRKKGRSSDREQLLDV